jgi:hypothetical protein
VQRSHIGGGAGYCERILTKIKLIFVISQVVHFEVHLYQSSEMEILEISISLMILERSLVKM